MQDKLSFHEQISRNKLKSFFLIFLVFVVLIALTYVIGLIYTPDFYLILAIGSLFSIFYVWLSYYFSDKIALASVSAKEASYNQYRQLHHVVEGLCLASGLPKPKIYIMPGNQINAFASGRDPKHAVIAVTEGAISKLDKQELEGVIAHELSHISNYDIRFMTLTAIMVGMISIIAQIFLRSLWFRGSSNDNRKGGNAVLMIIGILLAILAPIVVKLVSLSISRKREYVADASSVKFTRSPTGLIRALKKIKTDSSVLKVSGALSPLFMSDPSRKDISDIFQTHPSIEKRIKILEAM